jgi:hypothetical protein
MRRTLSPWAVLLGTAVLANMACRPASAATLHPADSPDIVISEWQHHHAKFSYFGITTLFTCDGLEEHLRRILLHLGARKDVRVSARGCPGSSNTPSRDAWVDADFYALAPAADPAAPDGVKARWSALEMRPQRPNFLDNGDCDLLREMKDLITGNFTLRNIAYRTDCFPQAVAPDSFEIKGQALMAMPPEQKPARDSG